LVAIFPTAKAIRRLEKKGIAVFQEGQPLNVRSRGGLIVRGGLKGKIGDITVTEAARRIRVAAEFEYPPDIHVLNLDELKPIETVTDHVPASYDFKTIYEESRLQEAFGILKQEGVHGYVAASRKAITCYKTLVLLERIYVARIAKGAVDESLVVSAMEETINFVLARFGLDGIRLFDEIPEFKKLLAQAPESKGHDGVSSSLHTFRILLMLSNILDWKEGKKNYFAPELRGRDGVAFTTAHHLSRAKKLIRYLDSIDIAQYRSLLTDNGRALVDRLLAVRESTEGVDAFLAGLDKNGLETLLTALYEIYVNHFMDFMVEVFSKVKNKKLLALSAALHDIGKIEDQAHHTKKGPLAAKIMGRIADHWGFSADEVRISAEIVEHHVLYGSVPLREENYSSFGRINGTFASPGVQAEFVHILALVGILDVAATGEKGRLYVPGMEMMRLLHRNYVACLEGRRDWDETCQLMTQRGYGFGRLTSFIGEDRTEQISLAIKNIVPEDEVSSFYSFITRTERFSQFFFAMKNFSVESAIKLFLALTRVSRAAVQYDLVLRCIPLKMKEAEALSTICSGIDLNSVLSQERALAVVRDHRAVEETRIECSGIVFNLNRSTRELRIALKA